MAEADIQIADANLDLKQLDIDKSKILSPVDGIVLKRAVEPGQTVASSLQAPVLFTLAEDLKHMQLEANIDEADIGTVEAGQKATSRLMRFRAAAFRRGLKQSNSRRSPPMALSPTRRC